MFISKIKWVLTGILAASLMIIVSMLGCGTEDPVAFVEVTPTDGSTILTDTRIIITFDGVPLELSVTGAKFSLSDTNVTLTGPFTPGALNLVLTWSDGETTLTYTVENPPPDDRTPLMIARLKGLQGVSTASRLVRMAR